MGAGEKQADRWLRELSTMRLPDQYSYHWPTFEFEKDYTLCSNTQGPRMQWRIHLRQSLFKLNSLRFIMGNPYSKRSKEGLNGPPTDTRTCVTIVAGCIGLIPIQRRRIRALPTPSGGPPWGSRQRSLLAWQHAAHAIVNRPVGTAPSLAVCKWGSWGQAKRDINATRAFYEDTKAGKMTLRHNPAAEQKPGEGRSQMWSCRARGFQDIYISP